jgi:hypothetical protein
MRLPDDVGSTVSPALTLRKRRGSSPPSPVFDLPPMRFMAMASVVCASVEIEPSDIAPVAKRLTISFGRLDLSSGTGAPAGWMLEQAAQGHVAPALVVDDAAYSL